MLVNVRTPNPLVAAWPRAQCLFIINRNVRIETKLGLIYATTLKIKRYPPIDSNPCPSTATTALYDLLHVYGL